MENISIYSSDNFVAANNEVYGAQELDTWAGIRLLAAKHDVWRLEICPNQSLARLVNERGEIVESITVKFPPGIMSLKDWAYVKALAKYGDSSISYFSRTQLTNFAEKIFSSHEFELLWWETQFYDALIPGKIRSIIRSVNFEPAHVLSEDASRIRFLRFLFKLFSEWRISRRRNLVAISPADSYQYSRLCKSNPTVLPLRQLMFISETKFEIEESEKSFIFFGSNFNVRHNLLNLKFILNDLAPLMQEKGISARISIFGHRMPSEQTMPPNVRYYGFADNLQGKEMGSLGVIVPYHGGAGMQSKIFEPMILGVPIIANPSNFAGYPFEPFEHYYPATNLSEYLDALEFFLLFPEVVSAMGNRAKVKSKEMFSRRKIESIIDDLIFEN